MSGLRSRREVLAELAALAASAAVPRSAWAFADADPLVGSIVDYVAGFRGGKWTAADVTTRALERCRGDGKAWRAIDVLAATATAEARDDDHRKRSGELRGILDGVPVFSKSIYDMKG